MRSAWPERGGEGRENQWAPGLALGILKETPMLVVDSPKATAQKET